MACEESAMNEWLVNASNHKILRTDKPYQSKVTNHKKAQPYCLPLSIV